MKIVWLLMVMLVGYNRCAYAVSPDPSCFPGESGADNVTGHIDQNSNGCVAYWYCDEGHRWVKYGFYGSPTECKAAVASMQIAAWMKLSHNEKIALWHALPEADPVDAATRPLFDQASAVLPAPPSGLITTSTIVYKQQVGIDSGYTMVAVGVVALNVPCNSAEKLTDATGDYYAIPRSAVSMTKIGKFLPPFPPTAYGKCT